MFLNISKYNSHESVHDNKMSLLVNASSNKNFEIHGGNVTRNNNICIKKPEELNLFSSFGANL